MRAKWFSAILLSVACVPAVLADSGRDILEATGVQGGVVVHVGCGDGELTPQLRPNDRYLVQGLDVDPQNVAKARQRIGEPGAYGPLSFDTFDGKHLPYIDNFANLIVVSEREKVTDAEIQRVLAPLGVAYVKQGNRWSKTVKPRPPAMDEWTHYLHDPTGNAVSHDSLVEPPRQYQWVGGSRYSRQHDHMSSVSAVVTSGGRVFYIFDEATRASILTPPRWRVIARDAFNGTVLWKRNIDRWHQHLWPLKSGPQLMARRLVAVGNRVYVTLGIDGPLTALDAATGETVRTYENTKATEEILCDRGVLLLVVAGEGQPLRSDPKKTYANMTEVKAANTGAIWSKAPRIVMAVDAASGKTLWRHESDVISMSLAADAKRVLFHDGQKLQCLDRGNGRVLWSSEPLPVRENMRSSSGATVVIYDDVILYSGMVAAERYTAGSTTMFALSADSGKTLWKGELQPAGHQGTPDDILVAGGLVWHGAVAQGRQSGVMIGRDLHSGEIKSQFLPDVETHWFHHRCYRAKATDKYLLFSRTGIEFIDHAAEHWTCHHWVRGACHYGVMPGNGLIYAPQHPCACYTEAKLSGFNALAPARKVESGKRKAETPRLQRGPAYAQILNPKSQIPNPSSWPTFRHDAA
ncbi:MAG: PQQ-binding-like beta-propeller repeat protein, partial [Candidatus Nealsonbacteria bacterium]|nr:PQQ-binding-like beta-propeller repeat protein [Candidatus Nealsonbacteria bacterium]